MKAKQIINPETIISIFKARKKLEKAIENSNETKTNEQLMLLQIHGLDKQQMNIMKTKLKSYQDIGNVIREVNFYYQFSADVLKKLNIKNEYGIIIALFQVISCIYIDDPIFNSDLYDILINSMLSCLKVQKNNYINETNSIIILVFLDFLNDKRIVLDAQFIRSTLKLFKEDKYMCKEIYFDFIRFICIIINYFYIW